MLLQALSYYAAQTGKDALWVSTQHCRLTRAGKRIIWRPIESAVTLPRRVYLPRPIDARNGVSATQVDTYWGAHTIWQGPFLSKAASLRFIEELTDGRPLKRELARLHGPHNGKVVMDYGCGPGNDLAGFAEFSGAREIIGADVSRRALEMARARVSWHAKPGQRFRFIQVADLHVALPIETGYIDYIQSLGVLDHTHCVQILTELARVLKPGGEIRIMVYNADSVHVQLTVGYEWRLRNRQRPDLTPEDLFQQTADLGAPSTLATRPPQVAAWSEQAGLRSAFLGGYFVPGEIEACNKLLGDVRKEPRLTDNQRAFVENLSFDNAGRPHFKGLPAGLSAMYRLTHI
jgi:ubiquinone/menaquinone biosynthesis C-methylase UbiE